MRAALWGAVVAALAWPAEAGAETGGCRHRIARADRLGLTHTGHSRRRGCTDSGAAKNVVGWLDGALETMMQYGYAYPSNLILQPRAS